METLSVSQQTLLLLYAKTVKWKQMKEEVPLAWHQTFQTIIMGRANFRLKSYLDYYYKADKCVLLHALISGTTNSNGKNIFVFDNQFIEEYNMFI